MKTRRLVLLSMVVVGLTILMGVGTALAQEPTPLLLGTVTGVGSTTCTAGYNTGTTCFKGTVNCTGAAPLNFIYGELGSGANGTIVIFNGGAGTVDQGPGGSPSFANDYSNQGYRVVQVVWNDTAWENTASSGSGSSIKVAACRPATVMHYVWQNIYSGGGMCAQGTSAGSGAIGYALAEYGAGSYIDNVELLSGPVFGDIEKGCVVPNTPSVTVCPASQTYCKTGTPPEGGWPDAPQYIGGDITAINNWSGINACNGSTNTTGTQNAGWKQMSLVDGLSDSSFSYPQTTVAGYLCSNTSVSCGSQPCQNNSAAEGQYFYTVVTGTGAKKLAVYRIDQCTGQEGVTGSSAHLPPPNQTESGYTAIKTDMLANCHLNH